MTNLKPVPTPLTSHYKLSEQSPKMIEEQRYMDGIPCANLVGSIMYAMVCTRSDIAYVVIVVSRFMSNLGRAHW